MKECFQNGADPGVCIASENYMNSSILDFGTRATHEVLTKDEALNLAKKHRLILKEIGGDGGGIIGALASVGLRASGNDGRLVDLKGIRNVTGKINVKKLLERTEIDRVEQNKGNIIGGQEVIDTQDWVRPLLMEGKAVLRVQRVPNESGVRVWTIRTHPKENKGKGAKDE